MEKTQGPFGELGLINGAVVLVVQGIKVTDADSRREALQRLKAEAAMRKMDIEEEGEAAAAGKPKRKKIIKIVKKKKKSSSKAPTPAAAAAGDAMEA